MIFVRLHICTWHLFIIEMTSSRIYESSCLGHIGHDKGMKNLWIDLDLSCFLGHILLFFLLLLILLSLLSKMPHCHISDWRMRVIWSTLLLFFYNSTISLQLVKVSIVGNNRHYYYHILSGDKYLLGYFDWILWMWIIDTLFWWKHVSI